MLTNSCGTEYGGVKSYSKKPNLLVKVAVIQKNFFN